jgi:hypothetical protein
MNDMTGQVLIIGDKVCDSRLHIFEIRITPQTVVDSRVAYTNKGIVRLDGTMRCTDVPLEGLREAYAAATEERRVSLREELLGRKDVIRRIKENQDIGYEQSGRA